MTSRQTATVFLAWGLCMLAVVSPLFLRLEIEKFKNPTDTESYRELLELYHSLKLDGRYDETCALLLERSQYFSFIAEPDCTSILVVTTRSIFSSQYRIMGLQFNESGLIECIVIRVADSMQFHNAADPPDKINEGAILNPAWRLST